MKENKKRNTKQALADSFKQLLREVTIEHITIKDIVEATGVIRPTFYNHFSDKYEVLEYIIWNDLLIPIKPLLVNDMITEGLTLLFTSMKNDRAFYENAVRIEGQNSFENIAKKMVTRLLVEVINEKSGSRHSKYNWLSGEIIAEYYAQSMCYVAISWIKRDLPVSPKELAEIYEYLSRNTVLDVFKDFE